MRLQTPCPTAPPAPALLKRAAASFVTGLALAMAGADGAHGFGFDDVATTARTLAQQPYREPAPPDPRLAKLGYDAWRGIRFRSQHALWHKEQRGFEVQMLHVSSLHRHPVTLYEVVDGQARPVTVHADAFDHGKAFGDAPPPPAEARVAGFRVHQPRPGSSHGAEVIAFLGASYFRAPGPGAGQYGLSARGVAIDTVGGDGEEFPRFESFWIERPAHEATSLTLYALLNSPRVTGAYRFVVQTGNATVTEVRARLYLRAPVATFGIAPLTSMFLSGENQPRPGDFRPEVHDSDGLQLAHADGRWVWRPLVNPAGVFADRFEFAQAPRGFGLMQRDRAFSNYQDTEARYERRPSAWVEPMSNWGAGRIELMQYFSKTEFNDNVVAYWVPAQPPRPGEPFDAAWRIHWQGDNAHRPPLAWVTQSRVGHGPVEGKPDEVSFVIDFTGGPLERLARDARPKAVVQADGGVRVLQHHVYRNPAAGGWRLGMTLKRPDRKQPATVRAQLVHGDAVLSETWDYALPPE